MFNRAVLGAVCRVQHTLTLWLRSLGFSFFWVGWLAHRSWVRDSTVSDYTHPLA